jgi:cytochrome oxidase Cu insertion factor (SCO1/SenC/PrrC family)
MSLARVLIAAGSGINMKARTHLLIIAGCAIVGAVGANYATNYFVAQTSSPPQGSRPAIGGAYTLTNHRGETITDQTFRGKTQLVFFGFTHCPDICPTALTLVSDLLEQIGPAASQVQPLFITVDPERDTPEVMARYVEAFHPSMVGLTGTSEQVAAAAAAFRVFYRKAPRPDGDYFMEHSGSIYVMAPDGAFRGTLDIHELPEIARDRLLKILGQSSASS